MTFISDLLYSQLFVKLPYPTTLMTGHTVIITGANSGLGFDAAKHCVRLGADRLILGVRDVSKGASAKTAIKDAHPARKCTIDVWELDLLSSTSIKVFAEKAMGLGRLDAVLENAGMTTATWKLSEGIESTMMTNLFGTALLALLLLPKLQETARLFKLQPRLSIVTSDSHMVSVFAERRETDICAALNREEDANMDDRYSVSKLLQIFFVREIATRLSRSNKPNVIVNCLTPGACHSQIHRNFTGWKKTSMWIVKLLIARSAEVGSRTLIAGINAQQDSHGQYMADCAIARPSELVTSEEGAALQVKLWDETMRILSIMEPRVPRIVDEL